jgi:hypothetical protein
MTDTTIEIDTREVQRDEKTTAVEAVIRFELPEAVVEDVRETAGDLDRDEISDRITVAPVVDGEPV